MSAPYGVLSYPAQDVSLEGTYVSQTPYLSIIVPAYNEAASIERTLRLMRDYLDRQPFAYQLIVSADGTDGTREAAAAYFGNDPRFSVIGSPQRGGKGKGVREGVQLAAGTVIGFVDADYKTPIEEIEKILPLLSQYPVVIGSRREGDSQIERPQRWYRRWGSRVFARIMRKVVGLQGVKDTQCGFKFFQGDAARRIFALQRVDSYMFDVEILRLARLLGYAIKEVGIRWQDDGDSRSPMISGTIRHARDLLRIRMMHYPSLEAPAGQPAH